MANLIETRDAARKELATRFFHHFAKQAWPIVVPGVPFKDGKHIKIVCNALQDVTEKRCLRLMIEMPPRHSKSVLCSILWPVWNHIKNPHDPIIGGAHESDLSSECTRKARGLIESDWFQKNWGDIVKISKDNNQKTVYSLISGGGYRSSSTEAGITGHNAQVLIGDDLIASNQGYSDSAKNGAWHWFRHGFCTRLNDRATGAIVLIGQRLAADDIQGRELAENGAEWRVICLPGRFEPEHPQRCVEDWRTVKGELLWPEHYGEKELSGLENLFGGRDSYGAAAQVQQRPAPEGGGMFKKEWFKPFDVRDGAIIPRDGTSSIMISECSVFLCGDIASKTKESNDDTAIVRAAKAPDGRIFILEIIAEKMLVPVTRERLRGMWAAGGLDYLGLEDAQCGIGIIQDLKADGINVKELKPGGKDKATRAVPFQNRAQAGQVYMNENSKAMDQLMVFPNGGSVIHDDIVDALAYVGMCCQEIPIFIGHCGESVNPEREAQEYVRRQEMFFPDED